MSTEAGLPGKGEMAMTQESDSKHTWACHFSSRTSDISLDEIPSTGRVSPLTVKEIQATPQNLLILFSD